MANSHNKVFTYAGLFGVGVVYAVLMIILIGSFLIFQFDTGIFVGLLCGLTVVCALIALIIYLCSRHVAKVDRQTKEKLDKGEYKAPKRGGF